MPDKRGSYVDPDEQHRTTNLFIGNLAPTLTEAAIIDLFSQFGDLISLKIMWPRTAEERERNRVSGFVCYRHRRDAEVAMDACNEADPFHVGRRLMARWGKNVSKSADEPVFKRQRFEKGDEQSLGAINSMQGVIPKEVQRETSSSKPSRRQDYRRRGRPVDGSLELEPQDLEEFHTLTRRQLCASRHAICEAVAFCFEHSSASTQICQLLKDLLLDRDSSVETRVARLYLLSDVLFNSQQPGIKNAFRYRDAIEKMAPAVFASLGQHGDVPLSRMTRHKIQMAVRAVLAAWTNWSVFDHTFLDELEASFECGKIIKIVPVKAEMIEKEEEKEAEKEEKETIILSARGDWTEVNEDEEKTEKQAEQDAPGDESKKESTDKPTQQPTPHNETGGAQELEDDDLDGDPLEEGDLDEEGLRRLHAIHRVTDDDGGGDNKADEHGGAEDTMEDSDIDGEPLDEEGAL